MAQAKQDSPDAFQAHPVSQFMLKQLQIEWVDHGSISPNRWNPNRMTMQDRLLLRQSLLEDGWTQPIVVLTDGTIVDGEQRWIVSGQVLHSSTVAAILTKMTGREKQGYRVSQSIIERLQQALDFLKQLEASKESGSIARLTGGKVPVTRVDFPDEAHQQIATIRHNRARGQHDLMAMSSIARDLQDMGLDLDDLFVRLGMDEEEAHRLLDQTTATEQMLDMHPDAAGFTKSWRPELIAALPEDDLARRGIERSEAAHQLSAQYEQARLQQKIEVESIVAEKIKQLEVEGQKVSTDDKLMLHTQVAGEVAEKYAGITSTEPRTNTTMVKMLFFVTQEEHAFISDTLGTPIVQGLIRACEVLRDQNYQFEGVTH